MQDRFDYHMDTYQLQLDRRDRLTDSLTLPVGICTLLCGAWGYFIKNVDTDTLPALGAIFIVSTGVLLFCAIYCLWRSYFGYSYLALPTSKSLESYWNELDEYAAEYPSERPRQQSFRDYLQPMLLDCNEKNTTNNDTKAAFLHKGNTYLLVAMIGCLAIIGQQNWLQAKSIGQIILDFGEGVANAWSRIGK